MSQPQCCHVNMVGRRQQQCVWIPLQCRVVGPLYRFLKNTNLGLVTNYTYVAIVKSFPSMCFINIWGIFREISAENGVRFTALTYMIVPKFAAYMAWILLWKSTFIKKLIIQQMLQLYRYRILHKGLFSMAHPVHMETSSITDLRRVFLRNRLSSIFRLVCF